MSNINEDFNEIVAGLSREQKSLPSKLFYDEKGSKLFDKICELDEYYPTRTELKIMEDYIDEITSVFDNETLFIEFGSGSSLKTRLLLEHLDQIAGYIPVDISEEHLHKSVQKLHEDFPGLDIYPVAADYTKPLKLPAITKKVEHKIAYYPGSTIGNFTIEEAKKFLKQIAELVGDRGGLLIGIDLTKDKKILEAAYNDSKGITAEFNLNILERLNKEFCFDFKPDNFYHKAYYNEDQNRIEMHLISSADQQFGSNSSTFKIKKGESILTEYSHKYSCESFAELASEYFSVDKVWTDDNEYFSVQFLTTN